MRASAAPGVIGYRPQSDRQGLVHRAACRSARTRRRRIHRTAYAKGHASHRIHPRACAGRDTAAGCGHLHESDIAGAPIPELRRSRSGIRGAVIRTDLRGAAGRIVGRDAVVRASFPAGAKRIGERGGNELAIGWRTGRIQRTVRVGSDGTAAGTGERRPDQPQHGYVGGA